MNPVLRKIIKIKSSMLKLQKSHSGIGRGTLELSGLKSPLTERTWNKVFEIGDAKTGTTSLHNAFRQMGLNAHQWSPKLYALAEKGKFRPVINFAQNYDAFTDGPWHDFDLYKMFDKKFPRSKFILIEREEKAWLKSYENHFSIKQNVNNIPVKYLIKDFAAQKDAILAKHKKKYQEVKEYFKDRPNDLLIMDICAGEGWENLCTFLNLPQPEIDFPHQNKSERVKN